MDLAEFVLSLLHMLRGEAQSLIQAAQLDIGLEVLECERLDVVAVLEDLEAI